MLTLTSRRAVRAIAATSVLIAALSALTAGRARADDPGSLALSQPVLAFVKTQNTGSGTVEVHTDAADRNLDSIAPFDMSMYHRSLDTTSDFAVSDASRGTFSMFLNSNGAGELGFIKTVSPGSGTVEVHLDAFNGQAFRRVLDATSDFAPSNGSLGTFSLFGSVNGQPQLGFVKSAGTPSGNVEIHVDDWNGRSYSRVLDTVIPVPESAMAAGTIQLRGSTTDGQPDLAYIANAGTSGVTFLSYGPGGYSKTGTDPVDSFAAGGPFATSHLIPDPTYNGTGPVPPPVLIRMGVGSPGVSVDDDVVASSPTSNTYFLALFLTTDFAAADAQNGSFFILD